VLRVLAAVVVVFDFFFFVPDNLLNLRPLRVALVGNGASTGIVSPVFFPLVLRRVIRLDEGFFSAAGTAIFSDFARFELRVFARVLRVLARELRVPVRELRVERVVRVGSALSSSSSSSSSFTTSSSSSSSTSAAFLFLFPDDFFVPFFAAAAALPLAC
jgi:hypothetical protein